MAAILIQLNKLQRKGTGSSMLFRTDQ